MRIPFIAGNWKMNLTLSEAENFVKIVSDKLPDADKIETAIAASPLFLPSMIKLSKDSPLKIAAQNCFYKDSGAYTGEVSPMTLKDIGVSYVILGHSERRRYFHETNKMINLKVLSVLKNGMSPIIGCDEKMSKIKSNHHMKWLDNPVSEALRGVSAEDMSKVLIAYEPSWAIGTGRAASKEEAEDGCSLIRTTISELYSPQIADQVRILYGGSVSDKNVANLMQCPDIDGVLAGKASLQPEKFLKLLNYQK
ncbi:triose-phosphate isomerase [Apilactobacillus sp. TMW 2.2459]|uniref:triose-phosphate isomerase n=1 Tax=Apilactobacillus xinyiensis TaxID=2841032 RepID=UPI001C7D789D|nr:triose-phosphate isomerase [Apilactobacillus xinyiensis]MCL0312644.1 triose-phosphate isomerase [Apilactobacillus xinyiensis]